jgi:hypothetical protein
MKIGVRKPSLKKSVKARTTGKLKRKAKKAVVPLYGKKGTGLIKNPKKLSIIKFIIKHLLVCSGFSKRFLKNDELLFYQQFI